MLRIVRNAKDSKPLWDIGYIICFKNEQMHGHHFDNKTGSWLKLYSLRLLLWENDSIQFCSKTNIFNIIVYISVRPINRQKCDFFLWHWFCNLHCYLNYCQWIRLLFLHVFRKSQWVYLYFRNCKQSPERTVLLKYIAVYSLVIY